ncbi:MAG: Na+/H+ antiporter subunit E [Eubacteriales bacterium]|nr:Na+/H+ antiporter subunit E [Eubacteriales bacterium]
MPIIFFAFWLVLNGRFTWEIAAFGAVLSAALYWFCVKFLEYSPKAEWKAIRKIPGMARYFFLLIKEIFKANFALMKIVYSPKKKIKPQLVTFHTPLRNPGLRSVLADSITLTPGTITVMLEDGEMTVHCLDESFAQGIEDLEFQRLLLKLGDQEEQP